MFQSHVIDVGGIFVGVAIAGSEGFRFVAVDPRLTDLDASVWPSLADVRRVVAATMTRNGHLPHASA